MDNSWKHNVISTISEDLTLLGKPLQGLRLLDYGCGNGYIGIHFCKKGVLVDLTDISKVLIDQLNQEYGGESNINIFRSDSPADIPGRRKYDVILAWNLFHHIDPKMWHQYLSEFVQKMKVGGLLLISGWDQSDPIIKEDHNKARYTQHETWFVNDLPKYLGSLPCDLIKDQLLTEIVPAFGTQRDFRYFIIRKQKRSKKS